MCLVQRMSIQNVCHAWNYLQEGCTYLDCWQWMLLLSTYYVHGLCKDRLTILFPFSLTHCPMKAPFCRRGH